MDPVSHLLFGRAAALTIRRRPDFAGLTTAVVLGSVFPDIDALLALWRFDLYLIAHAWGTHSLVGAVIEGPLLAAALLVLVPGACFAPLLAGSYIGIAGHIFWDLADGSDIKLLKPLGEATFGWHLVAMGDPIVLAVLAIGCGLAFWQPARARHFALATLVALSALLGLKKSTQIRAIEQYAALAGSDAQRKLQIEIAPTTGRLFRWTIYDRAGVEVRAWTIDAGSTPSIDFVYRDAQGDAVASTRTLPVVRAFFDVSTLPFARVEMTPSSRLVLWSDVRYCSANRCDLSFGGAFDGRGALLYQLIRIGGFTQRVFP